MADETRTVSVQALWDGTRLKAGTEDAADYMDRLADSVDDSTDQMRRSLQSIDDGVSSTFGSSGTFARSVDDVESTGGRLKDTGSEIGSEFAENIGEGIRSGDIGGTVLETFTSLGPALGVAGIGIAVGAGLVNGLIQGVRQTRAEFLTAVNNVFTQLEVTAKHSNARIKADIMDSFTFTSVMEQLGGDGGVAAGIAKVNEWVKKTGHSFNDIVDILRGDINPGNRDTLALLEKQAAAVTRIYSQGKAVAVAEDGRKQAATEILRLVERTVAVQDAAVEAARRNRDYLQTSKNHMADLSRDMERYAAAADAAAAAIAGIPYRNLPDPSTV